MSRLRKRNQATSSAAAASRGHRPGRESRRRPRRGTSARGGRARARSATPAGAALPHLPDGDEDREQRPAGDRPPAADGEEHQAEAQHQPHGGRLASAAHTGSTPSPRPTAVAAPGHESSHVDPTMASPPTARSSRSRVVAVARTVSVRPACSSAAARVMAAIPKTGDHHRDDRRRAKTSASCMPPMPPIASITARASAESSMDADVGHDRAIRHAHPRDPDGPADAAAVDWLRQARATASRRRGEPCAGPGRVRQQRRSRGPGAGAAPQRDDGQGGRQERVEHQHPGAGPGPRAQSASPSRGARPAQPPRRGVPDGAHEVEAHRSRPEATNPTARACSDLRATSRPTAGADQGDPGPGRPEEHRAGDRRAAGDVAGRRQDPDGDGGQGRLGQRGRAGAPRRRPWRRRARRDRCSSSTRVCRRRNTTPMNATKTAYRTVILVIASSPTVVASRTGP